MPTTEEAFCQRGAGTKICTKIDPKKLITHRFKLDDILAAYDTFGQAAKTHALKVIISA